MDNLTFLKLWDWYHVLLTPTQREITDAYFNQDLTLSEIAENKGISRQAVSECLATCKKQLAEYEEKLGLAKIMQESAVLKQKVGEWAKNFAKANAQTEEGAHDVEKIVNEYYSKITQ